MARFMAWDRRSAVILLITVVGVYSCSAGLIGLNSGFIGVGRKKFIDMLIVSIIDGIKNAKLPELLKASVL